jgi:hypothetical protein
MVGNPLSTADAVAPVPTDLKRNVMRMSESGGSSGTYKVTIDGDGVKVSKEVGADVATALLSLVMGGTTSAPSPSTQRSKPSSRRRPAKVANNGSTAKPAKKKAGSPGIVGDLVLRPKGKQSFGEFAAEKAPRSNQQKMVVAVYWLAKIGGMTSGVTVDHVNTCFVDAKWRRPTDLVNALSVTATRQGWLDTGDKSNIALTTRGEDEVQFNLPPPTPEKK